jgi:hypothetical protein
MDPHCLFRRLVHPIYNMLAILSDFFSAAQKKNNLVNSKKQLTRSHKTYRFALFLRLPNGPLTQLAEYLPFKQRVAGSSPARPTI